MNETGQDAPFTETQPKQYDSVTRFIDEDKHPVELRTPIDRQDCTYVYFMGQLYGLIRDWSKYIIGDPNKPFSFTRVHEWQTNHATFEDAIDAALVWVESCIVSGEVPE